MSEYFTGTGIERGLAVQKKANELEAARAKTTVVWNNRGAEDCAYQLANALVPPMPPEPPTVTLSNNVTYHLNNEKIAYNVDNHNFSPSAYTLDDIRKLASLLPEREVVGWCAEWRESDGSFRLAWLVQKNFNTSADCKTCAEEYVRKRGGIAYPLVRGGA